MYTEKFKVYISNIDKEVDVAKQCKTVLQSLSGKYEEFYKWTIENIKKGNVTPHSFNIVWEGDKVVYNSSRFISDDIVSELVAMAGNTVEVKKWLNNPDKGVELIDYSLTKEEL